MSWAAEQWRRLRYRMQRRHLERELADEIAFHREMRARKFGQQGMDSDEALHAAQRSLGNTALVTEDSRAYWGWSWLDAVGRDLRFASRQLRHHAAFSVSAVATLALGTGSAILVFALLYGVVLRPFAFADPEQLAIVWIHDVQRGIREEGTSYPTYLDWRAQSRVFTELAARGRGGDATLAGPVPERVLIDVVSANYLPMLGARPVAGRVFTDEEEGRGEHVAVISHSLALRRFGSAEAAIRGTIAMSGQVWQVVGVMPPRFGIPPARQDVWVPARHFPPLQAQIDRRSSDFFVAIGRLRPGASAADAEAELNRIGGRLAAAYPIHDPEFGGYRVSVVRLRDQVLGVGLPRTLWMLLVAVGLVLLVACVNVANLLLARGAARRAEFAVRVAVGAGAHALVRQQFVESALLTAAGGVLGLTIAAGVLRVLPLVTPADLPRFDELAIHPPVVAFAILVCACATVLFGGVPAALQLRGDAYAGLRCAGADRRSEWFQSAFLLAEFALAFVLIAAAGAFLTSLARVRAVEAGFRPERLILVPTELVGKNPTVAYSGLLNAIREIPGVEAAGAIGDLFIERNPDEIVTVQGHATRSDEQVTVDGVSPEFLATMGAPLRAGRFLTAADYQYERPRAVVINETFARRFFPGRSAVGQYLKFGTAAARGPWIEVVGVVGDMHRRGLEQHAVCEGFGPAVGNNMDVVVRSAVPAHQLAPAIERLVRRMSPNSPVYPAVSVLDRLHEFSANRRLQAWSLSGFAMLTILLAACGAGGLAQYAASQRRREMAIRTAIGASRLRNVLTVLAPLLRRALTGIAAGLLVMVGVSGRIADQLFRTNPLDRETLSLAACLLVTIAAVAAWWPALSVARADPSSVLRGE